VEKSVTICSLTTGSNNISIMFSKLLSVVCGSLALASTNAYTEQALADQVTNLPGAEKLELGFNQFSGYLTVDGSKEMHYWFVESMEDPANAPVAFWTNGGPGCSGLLGFMTEQVRAVYFSIIFYAILLMFCCDIITGPLPSPEGYDFVPQ
jgi:hypothetical protein